MTTISVQSQAVRVTFPGWERWMTGRRELIVPIEQITRVELLSEWTSEPLGWRSGLAISGFVKVGVFTHPTGVRRLVAMRRGLPVLRLGLAGADVDELLISDPDAVRLAGEIAAQLPLRSAR